MAKRKSFALNKDLQEGLSQTMSAVKNYAGSLHFEIIPLKDIELDPENPRDLALQLQDLPHGPSSDDPLYERKREDINSLQSLSETIKSQGVINPIVVYKHGQHYRLVAGERRCLASKMAGKEDIKANVMDQKPTEFRRTVLQWIENIEREDLTLWERIHNIQMIADSYQREQARIERISASTLRNILGCSLPQANNYHTVMFASQTLKDAIKKNQINNLEKAAFITRIKDSHLQMQALQAAISGASLKALKEMQNAHKKLDQEAKREKHLANNSRGRQATKVNLGATQKTAVINTIIDAVLQHDHFRHYANHFENLHDLDYASASKAFKRLISLLEEHHS